MGSTTAIGLINCWAVEVGKGLPTENDRPHFAGRSIKLFEQTFKNIDDVLHKDVGCGSELDYVEQSSWVLFLKYLDDLERERESSAI